MAVSAMIHAVARAVSHRRAVLWDNLVVNGFFESVRTVRGRSPKTILGFFGTAIAILVGGFVGFVWATTQNSDLAGALPWVGGFVGVVVVSLLGTTIVALFLDPSRLLLTNVSATDYVHIQREIRVGDSDSGERAVAASRTPGAMPEEPPADDVFVVHEAEGDSSQQSEEGHA